MANGAKKNTKVRVFNLNKSHDHSRTKFEGQSKHFTKLSAILSEGSHQRKSHTHIHTHSCLYLYIYILYITITLMYIGMTTEMMH